MQIKWGKLKLRCSKFYGIQSSAEGNFVTLDIFVRYMKVNLPSKAKLIQYPLSYSSPPPPLPPSYVSFFNQIPKTTDYFVQAIGLLLHSTLSFPPVSLTRFIPTTILIFTKRCRVMYVLSHHGNVRLHRYETV
jgi:hypothetical protein